MTTFDLCFPIGVGGGERERGRDGQNERPRQRERESLAELLGRNRLVGCTAAWSGGGGR